MDDSDEQDQYCKTCSYFCESYSGKVQTREEFLLNPFGDCCRYPPAFANEDDGFLQSQTYSSGYCGEWKSLNER